MNITVRNDYRVEVLLSEKELQSYGVTYEELDYAKAETRRVLWALADDIRRFSGRDFSLSGKLLIEVIKENEGNTRICFTHMGKEKDPKSIKQLVKSVIAPEVVLFPGIDEVISASHAVRLTGESALYEHNGSYALIIYVPYALRDTLAGRISEFGSVCENSAVAEAVCTEMWNCIIPCEALQLIRQVF